MFGLANPDTFARVTRPLIAPLWVIAAGLLITGAVWAFRVPEDALQGDTVRILFIHVPAASLGLAVYGALGLSCLFYLIFRHSLADAAARAAVLPGAAYTGLALITGALWGQPMWGTWWVWDARLTSMLVLFLLYVAYAVLRGAFDDEGRAARAASVLGLVGLINLPIVKFSVDWWNTLHQPASLLRAGGTSLDPAYLWPLLVMMAAYFALFLAIWLTALHTEIMRRRVLAMRARQAREDRHV